MASTTESLIFDLLANDRASDAFARLGKTAQDASGNVGTLTRRLDEISHKSVEARVGLKDDQASAKLDAIQARLVRLNVTVSKPDIKPEGIARAAAEIAALEVELDKLGKSGGSADLATKAVGSAGLSGMSGMGALIGAGVVLSPVLLTLATGLGGVALAAYGTLAPIEKAAQKTGGLSANMSKLDPLQKQVAESLLGLDHQYHAFQAALKPEVLGIFNTGLKIAGNLLHDIEPVAKATGGAFNQFLGQFGATLQDSRWQQFWAFMAQTAPADMKLVGNLLIDLTNDIPPLVQALQPAASAVLKLADDLARAGGATEDFLHQISTQDQKLAQKPSGGGLAGWLEGSYIKTVRSAENATYDLIRWIPGLGITSDKAAAGVHHLTAEHQALIPPLDEAAKKTSVSTTRLYEQQKAAQAAAAQVQGDAQAVTNLTTALSKGLDPLLAYSGALITQKNDAVNLNTALKASSGWIGLATQKQRDSFGAANQYISDLEQTAQKAIASHQGIGQEISSLQNALPALEHAQSHSKLYWQEVAQLINYLNRLRDETPISEKVNILGIGKWSVAAQGHAVAQGPGPFAAGGKVTGGIPGRDSVLIRAMPGELVVPVRLAAQVAPFLKDHGVPGMAAGGVVGGYSGQVGGLQPWAARDNAASVNQIIAAVAGALSRQIPAAGGYPGGGPTGAAQYALEAYAASLFPRFGWGGFEILPLGALWNRESGWNRFARNPSSGAYGIPQALPPTKLPFAGQAAGGSSAAAQIWWGENYIKGRYGSPSGAWAHEISYNWYDQGGEVMPGVNLVVNKTGSAETVIPGAKLDAMIGLLGEIAGWLAEISGNTAAVPVMAAAPATPSRASLGWGGGYR